MDELLPPFIGRTEADHLQTPIPYSHSSLVPRSLFSQARVPDERLDKPRADSVTLGSMPSIAGDCPSTFDESPPRRLEKRSSATPSLSSFSPFRGQKLASAIQFPRPAIHSPTSLRELPPSTEWIKHPTCDHYGNKTPRDGATTICVTPVKKSSSVTSGPGSQRSSRPSSSRSEWRVLNRLCRVEKVQDRDDVSFLPLWKRWLHKMAPIFSITAITAYWIYFAYRIKVTRDAEIQAHQRYIMARVFITVELGVAMPLLLHQFWQCFLFKRSVREKIRVVGNETPTVDVFVTCCGEDNGIIIDTVRAAADQDWPLARFRVIVLDDKHDLELEAKIQEMSIQNSHVFYSARIKTHGFPYHCKAGNLNHGLSFVKTLEGGAGKYMAVLDADMIPEREWLRAIIAHLVLDPHLALSCPPQLFYNVPENDPLLQSLNAFAYIAKPVKEAAGVAWCTGSGYAIRRIALEEIGGFPTGSLAEDVCTSSMLLGAGWKTAYVHEALQFGTVPDSFAGHMEQRIRWTIGTLQTSLKLNFCLWGPLVRDMTVFQRLSGFVYTISPLLTISLTASLFMMPIVLVSGRTMVPYADYDQLHWLVRLCFFVLVSYRVSEWVMSIPTSYRLGQRETGAMIWMAPFHAIAIVRSLMLPKWLGGKTAAFSSSGSIKCELNERDARLRAPLMRRLWVILVNDMAGMHLIYILFAVLAVAFSFARAFTSNSISLVPNTPDAKEVMIYLLTHAAWPPVLWLVCSISCCAPIGYAMFPPTMPDREELLDRNPVTEVAHPKESAKKMRWVGKQVWHEVLYGAVTLYICVIFIGSWFLHL